MECIIRKLTKRTNFGDALKDLEKQEKIPSTLKAAFDKLYAYTNDKNGIRHALMGDGMDVSFAEAKYMLVVCSAFVNYLNLKQTNILKVNKTT